MGRMKRTKKSPQASILAAIVAERGRQNRKFGQTDHDFGTWMVILTEELGEAARAHIEGKYADRHKELVQSAAVVVACLENLYAQRNKRVAPLGSR
jgi:NTP pyrophosphatase (non-canonical NTP hydrolase)